MSAYVPRTTAKGNLPHLLNIKRKPEPLGNKFKIVADAVTKMLLYLEIQRGKTPMRGAEFCNELHMITAACTMRLEKYIKRVSEKNDREVTDTFMGDSWFGSITAAVRIKKINN
eukprot:15352507-Ditylum_brightwellii.AAC.1